MKKWDTNKLSSSDCRVLLAHWVGEAVAKLGADQLYRRRLFETTGLAMTAEGTDDNLINPEGLDGPYTFTNADDGREPRDDVQPFSPADEEHPEGSSAEDDEGETEGDYTSRVRGSDSIAIPDDDDDLDADETTLPLECPPGYAFSRSASPALDASLVRRGLGWVKGFITLLAQARTRQDYNYSVNRPNRRYALYDASTREVHCCWRFRGRRVSGATGGGY